MPDFDLSGYNTVAERIAEFRQTYPDGSLRPASPDQPFTLHEIGGTTFLAYTAAAYRGPEDQCPGIGCAWEPVPGPTKFTRNSELQNAETAAWGRAIVAVGAADTRKGIATVSDIQNRQAEEAYYQSSEYAEQQAVPGLRTSIEAAIEKLSDEQKDELKAYFKSERLPAVRRMGANDCEKVIDYLMEMPT